MDTANILEIGHLMQTWGLCRDQGQWDRLARCHTPDGEMHVTWYSGSVAGFIAASRQTFKAEGPRSKHLIGQPAVEVAGERALGETSVQILGRLQISGICIDNISYARFIDRLVRHEGEWRIARRVAIYEKDRFDPVIPGPAFDRFMAETDFSSIPEPYRFIGYRLIQMGRRLETGILCDGYPDTLAYRAACEAWLHA